MMNPFLNGQVHDEVVFLDEDCVEREEATEALDLSKHRRLELYHQEEVGQDEAAHLWGESEIYDGNEQ